MPFRPDPFLQRFEPIRRIRAQPIAAYSVAVALVVLATTVRFGVETFSQRGLFLTFMPAVALSALIGGWRPGLTALGLSVLTVDYFFLHPRFSFWLTEPSLLTLAAFLVTGATQVALVGFFNEAVDRLARQKARADFLIDAAPAGLIGVGEDGRVQLANLAAERLFGYSRSELIGMPVKRLIPDALGQQRLQPHAEFMAEAGAHPPASVLEPHALCRDGSVAPVEIGLTQFEDDGHHGALALIMDVREKRASEQRQLLLAKEVQHRSRNLLTIVRALAGRTIPAAERGPFLAILESLERTHDLFCAEGAVPLRRILEAELAPFQRQVVIDGCDFVLEPKLAQDFTLIVHELATNGLKYGALSTADGRVSIEGKSPSYVQSFVWEESGGPPVRPPLRQGFGQTVLRELPKTFGGEASIDYAPTGLRYRLTFTPALVEARATDRSQSRAEAAGSLRAS